MIRIFAPIAALLLLAIVSCQKPAPAPPAISFFRGAGYIYSDTILAHGSIATFGVNAYKAGVDQLLRKCTIQRSINGGPDSTLQDMTLTTQLFSQYYGYTVGDSGEMAKYTFTIFQDNGLSSSVSAVITSN